MQIERHLPSPALRPFLIGQIEAWTAPNASQAKLRELPFPGVPVILGLESAWEIESPVAREREESFLAGLHDGPAFVRPASRSWSCIELRLTPTAAHRILGVPMHELTNRTVPLAEVVPEASEVLERIREQTSWPQRFVLVEQMLLARLRDAPEPTPEIEWSWHELRRTSGHAAITSLARELDWSHRRLIARFREHIGLGPKAVARVVRFDRAARALRTPSRGLADVAYDCGYFDQAHMNRDFRALGGTTPVAFRASLLDSGGVAA